MSTYNLLQAKVRKARKAVEQVKSWLLGSGADPDPVVLAEQEKIVTTATKNLHEYAVIQREDLQSSFNKMRFEAKHNNQVFISSEQDELARKIIAKFMDEQKRLVTLIAEFQWGKTGTILTIAYYLCTHPNDENLVDADQVYIITGLSDTEWEVQTKERLLPQFEKNVYHRGRINEVIPKLANASNALVIIDECHYASGSDQSVKLALENAGLLDIDHLIRNNIRIVQTSATPDNVLIDSNSWEKYHDTVLPVEKSPSYVSFEDLLKKDRIRECHDLTDACEAETLFEVIAEYRDPRYHIVRVPRRGSTGTRETIIDNIEAFCQDEDYSLWYHDSDTKIDDIDNDFETAPERHTVIIITDYWRAAKTINDTYIGVVHERSVKKPNSTTVVQSLAGRFVGHNKRIIGGPIIYTTLGPVVEYIRLWNNGFQYQDAVWRSTGVKSDGNGHFNSKDSYVHEIDGIEHQYRDYSINPYGWKLFFSDEPREQATEFVYLHLHKQLPKKKYVDGFYIQNDKQEPLYVYKKYFRDDKPFNKRIFKGLSGNNAKKATNWRQYALYRDPTDPSSLIWFIVWRKNVYPAAPADNS